MEVSNISEVFEDDLPPQPAAPPRTVTVLALLALAAGIFSYLGAYAVTDALAKAQIIVPLRRSPDPRPRLAMILFGSIVVGFIVIAIFMRYLSWRHFRRIDRMLEADAEKAG